MVGPGPGGPHLQPRSHPDEPAVVLGWWENLGYRCPPSHTPDVPVAAGRQALAGACLVHPCGLLMHHRHSGSLGLVFHFSSVLSESIPRSHTSGCPPPHFLLYCWALALALLSGKREVPCLPGTVSIMRPREGSMCPCHPPTMP